MTSSALEQVEAPSTVWRPTLWTRFSPKLTPYLFVLPHLVLFSIFMFFPLGYAVYISFHQWDIVGDPVFIGGGNYTRLIKDPVFCFADEPTALKSFEA